VLVEYASVSSDPIVLPHVVLYQPEIPPNTGSIIRLCANTGFALHLIKPMGFVLDDKRLRRAGLDYHEYAHISEWSSLQAYCQAHPGRRLIAIETGGNQAYSEVCYQPTDTLLFGPETRGLTVEVLAQLDGVLVARLPMVPTRRSLNLSNCVATVVYEAWRQLGFPGGQ
jgi:tRNA (cytidine/uridine-2'-O-)-methyltransferase